MKTKKIDFKNPSNWTIFHLCMNFVGGWELTENVEIDINRESFRDLLVKYDLQQYTDLLLDYQIKWLDIQKYLDRRRSKFDDNEKNVLPYKLKVARILKMFLSGEQVSFRDMVVSVSDPSYIVRIANEKLFGQLMEVFITEFKEYGLDETEYTKEEAIEEINSDEVFDDEWFFNNGLEYGELESKPKEVSDYYIEKYRSEHYKPREISIEIVDYAIRRLEVWLAEISRSAGAKIKNLEIGVLARELSILRRTNTFINQNEFSSIKDIKLSRETCRFIYEYFEFWNLSFGKNVYDKSKKDNRAKYIESLIRNYEKSIESSNINPVREVVIHDEDLELKIDLFKKVKDGSITPEKFYERFPSCVYW